MLSQHVTRALPMSKLIPARETRERLGGISAMTDWRRRKSGLLPTAIVINGRNFDLEHEIEAILHAYSNGASDADVADLVKRMDDERITGKGVAA